MPLLNLAITTGESHGRVPAAYCGMTPAWEDEYSSLFLADVMDGVGVIPASSVDLVFTSPPYNIGHSTRGGRPMDRGKRAGAKWRRTTTSAALANGYENHTDDMNPDEYQRWVGGVLEALWTTLTPTGAIYLNMKPRIQAGVVTLPADYLPRWLRPYLRQELVWARGAGINGSVAHYRTTHERILVIAKKDFRLRSDRAASVGDTWRIGPDTRNQYPGSFPLALPQRAIDSTNAEVVMDCFCGSGSTLVAAKRLGRLGIGIDNSPNAIAISIERLQRQPWIEHSDRQPTRCAWCEERFRPARSDAVYCSRRCRQAAWRQTTARL
jgi:DNA modification methylase